MKCGIQKYLPAALAWILLLGLTGAAYYVVFGLISFRLPAKQKEERAWDCRGPGLVEELGWLGLGLLVGEGVLAIFVIANFFMANVSAALSQVEEERRRGSSRRDCRWWTRVCCRWRRSWRRRRARTAGVRSTRMSRSATSLFA